MFTLTAERPDGQRLTLTEYMSAYKVTYTGLGPVAAYVNTSSRGMANGEKLNSTRVGRRNIVLTVYISGNVEENRIRLYSYFSPEHAVKLHYKNGTRSIYTEGVVEAFECNQFEQTQRAQISIICQEPYLIGAEEITKDISGVFALFEFPFSIEAGGAEFSTLTGIDYAILHNEGDVKAGFIISVFSRGRVVNPVIYNAITNEAIRIDAVLEEGYTLKIDTNEGRKKIAITSPAGKTENALHKKRPGSVWLQLATGSNYISFSAESGADAMLVTLHHNNLFVGV